MQNNSETLVDENGIEILVNYDYEKTEGYNEEPSNAASYVEPTVYTELKSVEVVIAGIGVDILPSLNEKQKAAIINKLTYDEDKS